MMKTVNIRPFILWRKKDVTGMSGTGMVAEGVEFTDGSCVMTWRTHLSSVSIYPNMKELISIHGHGGHAVIKWFPAVTLGRADAAV